jgi:hypothetical protein
LWDEQRQCEHPRALAYDSARQRRFEYFRTPKATRKFFANARQPQWGIAPRLVCQYREQISQAFAAVHQRLIQRLFNERGLMAT